MGVILLFKVGNCCIYLLDNMNYGIIKVVLIRNCKPHPSAGYTSKRITNSMLPSTYFYIPRWFTKCNIRRKKLLQFNLKIIYFPSNDSSPWLDEDLRWSLNFLRINCNVTVPIEWVTYYNELCDSSKSVHSSTNTENVSTSCLVYPFMDQPRAIVL